VQINYADLDTCSAATANVIVVDVWRSFTTTAYAFAAGVRDIVVVDSPDEAFKLQQCFPGSVLVGMGELGGLPAKGFDFGNSPADLIEGELRDRRVILCTPNGTPGLVRSVNARWLLAGSFVCAGATARYLRMKSADQVTFVCTEAGIEDLAYAKYMAALLQGEKTDGVVMLEKIRQAALQHACTLIDQGRLTEAQAKRLSADLDCCLALDRFDFAMVAQRRGGLLVMETA